MSETAAAPAKINLALVVGSSGRGGKHRLATVYQRVGLSDRVRVEPAPETEVGGYEADTIVRRALALLDAPHGWRVQIDKQIPVAAGLGGGSSDAGTALRLANETLPRPLDERELHRLAATLGADVPFFLTSGPQLGERDGTTLTPLALPQDYWVLVILPQGERKSSTAAVYDAFDAEAGFAERRTALLGALALGDLGALPANDLTSSPLADELRSLGAFRADVSGAGPAVYGLFAEQSVASAAHALVGDRGRTWIAAPAW